MKRRSPLIRFVTLAWATLQLAAPALTSIADGQLAMDNSAAPRTHIEATTSDSCPVVHSPDCGLCRILSTSSNDDASAPTLNWTSGTASAPVHEESFGPSRSCVALPFGRAPPTV